MKKIMFLLIFIFTGLTASLKAQAVVVDPDGLTERRTSPKDENLGGSICPFASSAEGYDCSGDTCLTSASSESQNPTGVVK
jgi:hypothetical protein